MQLFESSPEEDNRCPQVQQGPPPMPRSPPALPAGGLAPAGVGEASERRKAVPGNHGWGLFIYLSLYTFIFLPRGAGWEQAGGGWPGSVCAGMVLALRCAMGLQVLLHPTSPGSRRAQALSPCAWVVFYLSSGVGRLVWGLGLAFSFCVFGGFLVIFFFIIFFLIFKV